MHAELPGRISSTAVEATAIDLSVVIVNWNVRDLLARCLRSILDSARLVAGKSDDGGSAVWRLEGPDLPPCSVEVIVVDSASRGMTEAGARAAGGGPLVSAPAESMG